MWGDMHFNVQKESSLAYNHGQKSLGLMQYSYFSVISEFSHETAHPVRKFPAFLPPPPPPTLPPSLTSYTMLKLGKNYGYTSPTLFVGWGEGLGLCELQNLTLQKCKSVPRLLSMSVAFSYWVCVLIFLTDGRRWKLGQTYLSRALLLCARSRAPWVRKCGYLCIHSLVQTKWSVRTYVRQGVQWHGWSKKKK